MSKYKKMLLPLLAFLSGSILTYIGIVGVMTIPQICFYKLIDYTDFYAAKTISCFSWIFITFTFSSLCFLITTYLVSFIGVRLIKKALNLTYGENLQKPLYLYAPLTTVIVFFIFKAKQIGFFSYSCILFAYMLETIATLSLPKDIVILSIFLPMLILSISCIYLCYRFVRIGITVLLNLQSKFHQAK